MRNKPKSSTSGECHREDAPAGAPAKEKQSSRGAAARQSQRHIRDVRLGFLMHDVSRMRRRAFDEYMKPLGITRAQWWIIAHLSRRDGMVQTELASMLDVGKPSLSAVIDRLEKSGLIERRPHPSDRRAKSIFMTQKARKLLTQMQAAERKYNELILCDLSEADRDQLLMLLERVKNTLADFTQSDEDGDED
jgi:DNA-binding MarR family transcriptional regulator